MTRLDKRSRELREGILAVLTAAGRGHLSPAFSLVEILRVLYDDIMQYRPEQPDWQDRDRFILSKGHGCIAQYVLLAEKGLLDATELERVCTMEGLLGGHPEHVCPGIEASTGSLGHGLPIGLGFALNARYEKSAYRTFVVMGDGECNEGTVWEAAMTAAKHGLDNLVAIIDYNKQQSYGATHEVLELEPFADKWRAFGFTVREVDGHDVAALHETLAAIPFAPGRPSAVICHTVKGKGIAAIENNPAWHHRNRINPEEVAELVASMEAEHA